MSPNPSRYSFTWVDSNHLVGSKQASQRRQNRKVEMLGLNAVGPIPVTVSCSLLDWSWLKYLPRWADSGFYEQPPRQSIWMPSGRGYSLCGVCQHLRQRTGAPCTSLEIPDLFSFSHSFFFFQVVNVSSLFLSLAHVDLLSIMTFGFILQPFSLSLFYGSMLLLAELIFQKTDGSDPVLSK